MGKIILLFLALIFIGCEQTFDNLIETNHNKYQVTSASTTPADSFKYNTDDSLITLIVNFTSSSEVNEVFCDIFASDESKLNSSPFQLFDNNGNRFENDFPLSEFYPIGIYNITYYIKNPHASMQQIARGSFNYDNGQPNLPPEIANTVVDPDTVVVTAPTAIFTSVQASDPNGQNDILKVYFIVFRPDGSTNGSELELFDDGKEEVSGDSFPGDGVYSRIIQINETNAKGTYRFEFSARDRRGILSNKIDHFVLIQ